MDTFPIECMVIEKDIYNAIKAGDSFASIARRNRVTTDSVRTLYYRYERELKRMESPLYVECMKHAPSKYVGARTWISLTHKYSSIEEVAKLTDEEIMKLRGIGKINFEVIKSIMEEKNLSRPEPSEEKKNCLN